MVHAIMYDGKIIRIPNFYLNEENIQKVIEKKTQIQNCGFTEDVF